MENLIARSKEEKSLYKKFLILIEKDKFELVRIKIFDGPSLTLQIMIDHKDREITIDDCAKISKDLSKELENDTIIDKEYQLEVSSPGLNRPLTRLKDFEKWKGFQAEIFQNLSDSKLYKIEGTIVGILGSQLHLHKNDQIIHVELYDIQEAKLVA